MNILNGVEILSMLTYHINTSISDELVDNNESEYFKRGLNVGLL